MENKRKVFLCFILLIAIAVICRLIPMPAGVYGVTPMYAMAIFGGVIFRKEKKFAFLLPILSFFVCDLLVEVLYKLNAWTTPGFYDGQLLNYVLFALLTFVGLSIRKPSVTTIGIGAIVAPTVFYLLSNFGVWLFAGFYPMTAAGLKTCYIAGWPFYFPYSIIATICFSAILFGIYELYRNKGELSTKSSLHQG